MTLSTSLGDSPVWSAGQGLGPAALPAAPRRTRRNPATRLELGAPARKDLDGFIDGSHKKASRPHVEKGVQLHGPRRGQQPAGQPAQAGKFGKVGHLPHNVHQLSWLGNKSRMNPGKKPSTPTLRSWESERLTREFPQIKARLQPAKGLTPSVRFSAFQS